MPIINVNGIDIYYEIHGVGEPLLLIFGTGGDHTRWNNQLPAFSKEFQCIVFDNRGTGKSSKPATDLYSSRIMAEDAACLLGALKISSAHIAGYSLGSAIGQEIAITHPGKVRSLSLYSTWDRCYPHFRRRFEVQAELVKLDRQDLLAAFAVLTLLSPGYLNEHDAEAKAYEKGLYSSTDPSSVRTPAHALLGHYQADVTHDTSDRLDRITAPTLIVVGGQDPLTRPEYAQTVRQKIPHSELVVIDGADHMMAFTMADKFNEVALTFLRRHKAAK